MTDIVLVALIGVAGTLAGGVIGPLAKDRLDRRARRRDETRAEVGEILMRVDALLMQMLALSHDDADGRWRAAREKTVSELSRLSYLLNKGEGEVAQALSFAMMMASADGTRVTAHANHAQVTVTTSLVAAWYRGERSVKGIQQGAIDAWQMTYDGIVSGVMIPNGKLVERSELDQDELKRRDEIEADGGVIAMARPRRRRIWPFRR